MNRLATRLLRGFTLLELLIVVAIIAILVGIAVPNFLMAQERALMASDAANMKTIATALQAYLVDYNTLPLGDTEAGPFSSSGPGFTSVRNGPAAGGSLDGLPWVLHELGFIGNWKTMFCPRYLKLFSGGTTIRGGHPRYHNFRYAYNSAGAARGGHSGGQGNIMSGETWIVRDLGLPAQAGWFRDYYPDYPADYSYPWGDDRDLEFVMKADLAVKLVKGGTDEPPDDAPSY